MIGSSHLSRCARSKSVDDKLPQDSGADESGRVSLTQLGLLSLRLRALRRGVWFKALSKIERGLIDLTLKMVRKVRSLVLAKSLTTIVEKLLSIMEGQISHQTRAIGFPLAQKLSRIAQSWGNKSSVVWGLDSGFARFLAICHSNTSITFKG